MKRDLSAKQYDLAAVDLLRERMQVGYGQAREALEATDGDVVDALVWLEHRAEDADDDFQALGERVTEKISEVMAGQQVADIRIKLLDKAICQFPTALAGITAAAVVLVGELVSHSSVELLYAPVAEPEASTEHPHLDRSHD